MNYSDGKIPTMRPLEGERATKWRGGAVRQEPQMTLPQAGRRLAVRASFWPICPSGNDCMLPADIVISSGETRRYGWQRLWALMKRRVERPPATMWRATFRREISPLRSASVEMTGAGRYHLFLHGPFVFRTDAETVSPFIGLYQQRGEKAGPKSFLCRSAQSMEAEREGQKLS